MVVPSFTIGVLGKALFGIGFADGILVIIFFNLLGSFSVCYFSTFGPAFGLRQMVLSRFWFGWWGVKLSKWICCHRGSSLTLQSHCSMSSGVSDGPQRTLSLELN